MKGNLYREVIESVECAFAYHKAVFNDDGDMIDYVFVDVNASFENLTGLKREDIINKRFVKDVCSTEEYGMKWVNKYKDIVNSNKVLKFEDFSENFNKHYVIKAYSPEKDHFVTVFQDKTFEKKMKDIVHYFIENIGNNVDYDKITEFAHNVTGASYTAFNLFEREGREFTTVSLLGVSNHIKKAVNLLGFDVLDNKWNYDPIREEKIKENIITHFNSIQDLTGDVISKKVIKKLENLFNIGNVVVARVTKEGKSLGDFTLIFKKGEHLKNQNLLELYLFQLGLFIEKTRIEKSLKLSQKRFFTLAEYAPIGFLSCNINGEIMYANKKLLEIMDSPSYEHTKEINLFEFQQLKERGFSDKLKECMEEDKELTFEMGYRSMWGKNTWLRVHFKPHKDYGEIIGANIVVDDITGKKKDEEKLKEKASRDPLTRAYNRNAIDGILLDRLEESKKKKLVSCGAIIDIDNFKEINDTYGHIVGDKMLKYLSSRIKQELREDDLIIRTGGDEFLVYLHDIKNEKNASYFIKRIFEKCSSTYRIEDELKEECYSLDVSCSIGVSFYPKDGNDLEVLMAKADKALYEVKKSGKDGYRLSL